MMLKLAPSKRPERFSYYVAEMLVDGAGRSRTIAGFSDYEAAETFVKAMLKLVPGKYMYTILKG